MPDRDSTPDNKKDGEDDIDIAKVILAISTGTAKTYFTLTIGLLAVRNQRAIWGRFFFCPFFKNKYLQQ